ncbi:hypothetical protein Dsin_018758 [Dipteronia sinensis]|uniref:Reverse transcriptase zinc-binding domain-containing protein n=1 Tax=Dipteronia sinensis TaxID=43782 RepID=A0AAE0A6H4_9ROSI|nr:hypothetical protein Dsin_018758 [Dipteronia sinensis]
MGFVLWLAIKGRLSTLDRVQCYDPQVVATCVLCNCQAETYAHIFIECLYSKPIWTQLLNKCGCLWIGLSWNDFIEWVSIHWKGNSPSTKTKSLCLALVSGLVVGAMLCSFLGHWALISLLHGVHTLQGMGKASKPETKKKLLPYANGNIVNLFQYELSKISAFWHLFVCCNLCPTLNASEVSTKKAKIVFALMNDKSINLGEQVVLCLENSSCFTGIHRFITSMCKAYGVGKMDEVKLTSPRVKFLRDL